MPVPEWSLGSRTGFIRVQYHCQVIIGAYQGRTCLLPFVRAPPDEVNIKGQLLVGHLGLWTQSRLELGFESGYESGFGLW